MARIRTIKPEFPQSESIGRCSRDARLLFAQLWTICDDSGRTRAASRMLASLLFPYDDDAPSLIDEWLDQLDSAGCILLYEVGGNRYLQVCNWLIHQKIDKPSASKFPGFDEGSRIFAKPRERSSEDQGPRTKEGIKEGIKDQGPGEDQGPGPATASPRLRSLALANGTAESFDRFWNAYPRKVGKDDARKAWAKRSPPIARILEALEWQRESEQWKRDGGQFIPHPATYINRGQWEDERPPTNTELWLESRRQAETTIEGEAREQH